METVRKGKALKDPEKWAGFKDTMKEFDIPDWYIKSCEKIISLLEKLQNDDDTNEGINSLLSGIEEGFLNKLALAKLS